MKVTFYGNAFYEFGTSKNQRIVCDPWILDGCWYGSWFHYPPFTIPESFYKKVDYIYLSHLHPDHLDPRSLRLFDRDTPIIVSARKDPSILNVVKGLGFRNVQAYATGAIHEIDGFQIRVWNDFIGQDVSRHDAVGFELDSSIAFIEDGRVHLNLNDNIPEENWARKIKQEFPVIDFALVPYSGGGSYPHNYENLSDQEKAAARQSLQDRFLNNFFRITRILDPNLTCPCAGEFVFAGKNWRHTRYVHTPTPSEIGLAWERNDLPANKLVQLYFGDQISIPSGQITRSNSINPSYTHQDRISYAESKKDAPYVVDEFRFPSELRLPEGKLLATLNKVRRNLGEAQKKYNSYPDLILVIHVPGHGTFQSDMREVSPFEISSSPPNDAYLRVTIEYEYLFALLTQHVHWNNLENGCHVKMFRSPERYTPDIHMLMSFFHF